MIGQLVLATNDSRKELMALSVIELFEYYEDIHRISIEMRKAAWKSGE